MSDGKKSLIVEGWRFIHHSYAVVNQWQLLALLRRSDISLRISDAPFFNRHWQIHKGLFDAPAEEALETLPIAPSDSTADVTLRISYPFDFSLSRSRLTAVFATSERQSLGEHCFCTDPNLNELRGHPQFRIVTPSTWSAQTFLRLGFRPEQVLVVPHGVEVSTFQPRTSQMADLRGQLNLSTDNFVFLTVGAMSGNKGIDLLLKGFLATLDRFPQARLVLKGADSLYPSKQKFLHTIQNMMGLSASDQQRLFSNLRYVGMSVSHASMAKLYQTANAYVSPYKAEGFNMPVMEAAACGIPLIVTRGGPTDDFVTDAFARRIDSAIVQSNHKSAYANLFMPKSGEATKSWLKPNLDHLIAEMSAVITDQNWQRAASAAGPAHVRAHYTWDHIADMLVAKLWN